MRRLLLAMAISSVTAAAPLSAQRGQDQTVIRQTQAGFIVDFTAVPFNVVLNALAEAAGIAVSASNPPTTPTTLKLPDPISQDEILGVLEQVAASAGVTITNVNGLYVVSRTGQQGRGGQQAQPTTPVDMSVFVLPVRHANNQALAQILTALFATTGGRGGAAAFTNFQGGRGNQQQQQQRGGGAGRAGGGGIGGGGRGGRGGGGGDEPQPTASLNPAMLDPDLALAGLLDRADLQDVRSQQIIQELRTRAAAAAGGGGDAVVFQQGAQGGAALGQAIGQLLGPQAAQALQVLQQGAPGSTDPRFVPMDGTNQILVRATPADFALIQAVVAAVDLRPLQVLIEVSIVEVRRSRDLNVGVSGSANYTKRGDTDPRATATLQRPATFDNARDFVLQLTGGRGTVDFTAALNALSIRGDVKIASLPVIIAQNNRTAQLIVGEQRPFVSNTQVTDNGAVIQSVQYRDVATNLLITPTINADGYVNLDVSQTIQDATSEVQFDAPVISSRQAITSLFVANGQTAVIGGLSSDALDRSRSGIPILGSIPIIGHLFGATRESRVVTELYLFLTPHVVFDDAGTDYFREVIKANSELIKGVDLKQIVPQPDTTFRVVIPIDTATITRIPQRTDTMTQGRIPPAGDASSGVPPLASRGHRAEYTGRGVVHR